MSDAATDGGRSRPEWKRPALRCGLEVSLLALIAAWVWVTVDSALVSGLAAVAGLVGGVAILFYYLNRQALAWVRYASAQGRRRDRRRRRRGEE